MSAGKAFREATMPAREAYDEAIATTLADALKLKK